MPKISVVIPTQNRAEFLRAAIQSVLNQTFQDFEIIIIDDASVDETANVIQSFEDPRIRYVRHETKGGQGATRNAGIRQASGEYIALLDDDDEWLPEKLERQSGVLDRSPLKVGLVYTGFSKIDTNSRQLIHTIIPRKRGSIFNDMCTDNWIGTCSTVMLRKQCFDVVGLFDESLAAGADYDLWLRISKDFDIEYVTEALVLYRMHGHSISTNNDSQIQGVEGLLRKHGRVLAQHRKSYSSFHLALGVYYCYRGDLIRGRKAFINAIRAYPFDARCYYNLSLSLAGAKNFRNLKNLRNTYFARRHNDLAIGRSIPLIKTITAVVP